MHLARPPQTPLAAANDIRGTLPPGEPTITRNWLSMADTRPAFLGKGGGERVGAREEEEGWRGRGGLGKMGGRGGAGLRGWLGEVHVRGLERDCP